MATPQQYGLPRPTHRPELTRASFRRQVIKAAEALMAAGPKPPATQADEATLFQALHACAYLLAGEEEHARATVRKAGAVYRRLADHLVSANLGLIYEMRRRVGPGNGDEDEYRSTGFWSLYQAVLSFDPWRGVRFSTYACNAILNGYGQIFRRHLRRQKTLRPLVDETPTPVFEPSPAHHDLTLLKDRLMVTLHSNSAGLNATERFIIARRFLDNSGQAKMTLADIGKLIKVSKERVRQLQIGALAKLRDALQVDPMMRDALPAAHN